ncbi:TPA: hypothetical protein ACGPVP_004496 [Enterobacter hormaechei]
MVQRTETNVICQAESVKRANLPPVAKHSQTKTTQPHKEAA